LGLYHSLFLLKGVSFLFFNRLFFLAFLLINDLQLFQLDLGNGSLMSYVLYFVLNDFDVLRYSARNCIIFRFQLRISLNLNFFLFASSRRRSPKLGWIDIGPGRPALTHSSKRFSRQALANIAVPFTFKARYTLSIRDHLEIIATHEFIICPFTF
jgi:hypothetical protein